MITSENLNTGSKTEECKSKLNIWIQRDYCFGRIYLTEMESLPRCIYPASYLAISTKASKTINQLNFNFILNLSASVLLLVQHILKTESVTTVLLLPNIGKETVSQ